MMLPEAEICAAYKTGATLRQLRAKYDNAVSHETIRTLLKRNGVKLRTRSWRPECLQITFKIHRDLYDQMGGDPSHLARCIVETVIAQNLVRAVLDDGVTE